MEFCDYLKIERFISATTAAATTATASNEHYKFVSIWAGNCTRYCEPIPRSVQYVKKRPTASWNK